MSYKIEDLNGCTKKLSFTFEKLDLAKEIKAELQTKRKEASLKGFRKGKAPMAMVEKFYGGQVENDALNRFVQNQLFEAINTETLKVVGYPSLENVNYEAGKSVTFEAKVEIFPSFDIKDMSKLSFKKDSVEVKTSDVEEIKKSYLASKAEMTPCNGNTKVKEGVFAVMDFQGITPDGEKPESMKGEEFVLEIGSGQFIPGFEEGMLGMKKGEEKVIELTFPENYHSEELQNAQVKFEVKLLEIKEKIYPDFTDEMAVEFGYESVANFEEKNKASLFAQKEKQVKEKLQQEILEKLISENSFDVPSALVTQQETHLKEDLTKNLKQQGFNDDMVAEYFVKWASDLEEKAKFQVRSGLILDKLANDYNVEASEDDLNAKIAETAMTSGLEAEQVKEYYTSDANVKKNLMYAIREEKTFDKLIEQVKVK
ncbi:MAG: trigger factor [Bacteriovoracaceae bacterium]|nr:trigger factor [Bacteriovoracaceae bacterium]